MKKLILRTITTSLLVAAALSSAAVSAQSLPGSLQSITVQDAGFDLLIQLPVAFWGGMSRQEFNAHTSAGPEGVRQVQLGEYTFIAREPAFNDQGELTSLSLEYRTDDPVKTEAAFEAYRHALGDIKPDYERISAGTKEVPDLLFAMIGWKSPDGRESALARIHSYAARDKSQGKYPAGLVTFAVKRQ